ncbi:hypothetical protein AG1IA_01214 [Rhizoctonia solani AG-1 IA]|uniref:Uncharacterized protein n=1 Tax=Thanatephorus cucumeris (strain AG1-IA) TaxID=983506 RepID=L8X3M9_THACA|nr:hypothetical protein AG1IA_01214 [Rhizoctonia solani AG-1 IA]
MVTDNGHICVRLLGVTVRRLVKNRRRCYTWTVLIPWRSRSTPIGAFLDILCRST